MSTAALRRRLEVLHVHGMFEPLIGDARMGREQYLPPWRDRVMVSGDLGPQYGPDAQGYRRQVQDWEQSRAGGGLWDPPAPWRSEPPRPPAIEDYLHRVLAEYSKVDATILTERFLGRRQVWAIARELGRRAKDVDAVVLGFLRRYMAASGGA